jgi:hypothetical protein
MFAVAATEIEPELRIAQGIITLTKQPTKAHEPVPLRIASAARSPTVSWVPFADRRMSVPLPTLDGHRLQRSCQINLQSSLRRWCRLGSQRQGSRLPSDRPRSTMSVPWAGGCHGSTLASYFMKSAASIRG